MIPSRFLLLAFILSLIVISPTYAQCRASPGNIQIQIDNLENLKNNPPQDMIHTYPYAQSLYDIAIQFQNQSSYVEAEHYLLRAIEELERQAPGGSKKTEDEGIINYYYLPSRLGSLAQLYGYQDKLDLAVAASERAVTNMESFYGPKCIECVFEINNLASDYEQLGSYEKARQAYERVSSIYASMTEAKLGNDREVHSEIAANLWQLGYLHSKLGNDALTESYYLRALAFLRKYKQAGGNEVTETAGILDLLGDLYFRKSLFPEAESYFTDALKLLNDAYGKYDSRLLNTLERLALLYRSTKRVPLARKIEKDIEMINMNSEYFISYYRFKEKLRCRAFGE